MLVLKGYYSNHSLRRTCATQLYDKGLPEQLMQETTGHRSAAGIRCYKHTSSSPKRRASEIVKGSLKEEDIPYLFGYKLRPQTSHSKN